MADTSFKKIQNVKARDAKLNTLPNLKLFTLDSVLFDVTSTTKPIVLIHFNSDCEHCQYEVSSIQGLARRFEDVELIFFSTETITAIRQFALTFELIKYSNIHFTKVDVKNIIEAIGSNSLSAPHIFIYGPDKKLRKEFRGETKPEAILKYIQ
jgi:thiol-disulfide isomerase/thioredoxin